MRFLSGHLFRIKCEIHTLKYERYPNLVTKEFQYISIFNYSKITKLLLKVFTLVSKISINGEKSKTKSAVTSQNIMNRGFKVFEKWHLSTSRSSLVFAEYVKARSFVYIFALATLVALLLGSHGDPNLLEAIRTVIASYFLALAAYTYNDMTDQKVDAINKTNRPSITGRASRTQLRIIVSVLFGSGLLLTFSINLNTMIVAIAYTALALAYSHPKSKLKDKFPLKTAVTAAGGALLSILGGTSVSNNSLAVVYAASLFFSCFFILSPLGDIGDIKGDRMASRRTFPIVMGIRFTLFLMLSIPIIIIGITLLANYCGNWHMKIIGIYTTVSICCAALLLLFHIRKRLGNSSDVKSVRPKMRYFVIGLQLSLLLTFL
jgi:4-hydroxybenzoate polyprenyltransferase